MKVVGSKLIRPDAYEKVLGKAMYPDDYEFEGMLYGAVVRSTIPYGKLVNINIDEIKNIHGVVEVIDYNMIPGEKSHGVIFKDIPILVKDIIKRVGDPLIIVVAKNKNILKEALEIVKVEYEEYKGVFTIEEALDKGAPILGDNSNILHKVNINKGDIEAGFDSAEYVVENWYSTQMTDHAFLQPEAAVAKVNDDKSIDVYVATQYPHYDLEEVTRCLNLSEDKVRIHNTTIGGAFGGREDINPQCHVAVATYITGKPVKILYSREESTISHSKRHPMKMYYKTGVDKNGKLCALKARIYADTGAYASWGINVIRKAAVHASGPYFIPNVDIEAISVYTNNPYCGAMRGFGAAQVPIAIESQMDILAEKIKINPLKFRYINALEVGSTTVTGQILQSSVGLKKCIEKIAGVDNVNL